MNAFIITFWVTLNMMTSSNLTSSALLAPCVGNSPATSEFPSQRPAMRSFDVFFDLRLNKRLCKPSGRRWFDTPSRSLWRHSNENFFYVNALIGLLSVGKVLFKTCWLSYPFIIMSEDVVRSEIRRFLCYSSITIKARYVTPNNCVIRNYFYLGWDDFTSVMLISYC